ncbi:MAG: hypothetical protein IJP91_02645, partial [Synergistaceae bacterium]|nr:hypothetical protein [Synergistaceae bacterium]
MIGSSSLRRRLQLERIFPDAKIIPVRGNVNTRLRKLDAGEFSGLVLAVAGLERLGLSERVSKIFEVDEVMPAPGQGILACQGRGDEDYFYLDAVRDEESKLCAKAERSFARALNAGCNVPVGAYARVDGGKIFLRGLYIDERTGKFFSGLRGVRGMENFSAGGSSFTARKIFRRTARRSGREKFFARGGSVEKHSALCYPQRRGESSCSLKNVKQKFCRCSNATEKFW